MTPDDMRAWFRVLRDIATFVLGVTIVLFELLGSTHPDKFWVGTGAMLMGVAPVLQLGRAIQREDESPR